MIYTHRSRWKCCAIFYLRVPSDSKIDRATAQATLLRYGQTEVNTIMLLVLACLYRIGCHNRKQPARRGESKSCIVLLRGALTFTSWITTNASLWQFGLLNLFPTRPSLSFGFVYLPPPRSSCWNDLKRSGATSIPQLTSKTRRHLSPRWSPEQSCAARISTARDMQDFTRYRSNTCSAYRRPLCALATTPWTSHATTPRLRTPALDMS